MIRAKEIILGPFSPLKPQQQSESKEQLQGDRLLRNFPSGQFSNPKSHPSIHSLPAPPTGETDYKLCYQPPEDIWNLQVTIFCRGLLEKVNTHVYLIMMTRTNIWHKQRFRLHFLALTCESIFQKCAIPDRIKKRRRKEIWINKWKRMLERSFCLLLHRSWSTSSLELTQLTCTHKLYYS